MTVQKKIKWLVGLLFVAVAGFLFLPEQAFAGLSFGLLVPNLNNVYGTRIDSLYSIIFWIVAIIFFGTEGALVIFLFAFRKRPGHKAQYSHGNIVAEMIWTLIPALILIWLAFYQKKDWAFIKAELPASSDCQKAQVFAEQFAWNFRYAGPDGQFGTADDVMTINQLHVQVGKKFLAYLSAKDVIHRFFIPYARIKQDAVPGMLNHAWFEIDKIPVWDLKDQKMVFFTTDEIQSKKVALDGFAFKAEVMGITGKKKYHYEPFADKKQVPVLYQGKVEDRPLAEVEYVQHPIEIACAQLCGLGHYRMIGYVTVETPETFDRWMKQAVKDKLRSGESKWTDIWDKYLSQYNTTSNAN
jgi:heme/copper-type cytochrome/quinol oxidase subunit 2